MPQRLRPCTTIDPLPQTSPICWFTALLMALFYSDGLRTLWRTRYMATWARVAQTQSPRAAVLTHVHRLVSRSRPRGRDRAKTVAALEAALDPTTLLRLLHAYAPTRFPVSYPTAYSSELYLPGLLDLLGVRSVAIADAVPSAEGNKWRLHIRQLTTQAPPILIVHVSPQKGRYAHTEALDVPSLAQIRLGRTIYAADALILGNIDPHSCQRAHKIAGITCHGQRYIYNGWPLNNGRACPLFPYDWLSPDAPTVCLSTSRCALRPRRLLDQIAGVFGLAKDLCFRPLAPDAECTLLYVPRALLSKAAADV